VKAGEAGGRVRRRHPLRVDDSGSMDRSSRRWRRLRRLHPEPELSTRTASRARSIPSSSTSRSPPPASSELRQRRMCVAAAGAPGGRQCCDMGTCGRPATRASGTGLARRRDVPLHRLELPVLAGPRAAPTPGQAVPGRRVRELLAGVREPLSGGCLAAWPGRGAYSERRLRARRVEPRVLHFTKDLTPRRRTSPPSRRSPISSSRTSRSAAAIGPGAAPAGGPPRRPEALAGQQPGVAPASGRTPGEARGRLRGRRGRLLEPGGPELGDRAAGNPGATAAPATRTRSGAPSSTRSRTSRAT